MIHNWLYALMSHRHKPADGNSAEISYLDLADRPAYPAADHAHSGTDGTVNIPQGSVTGLTTALAGKANAFTGYTGEIWIVDANATSFSHRLTFSNGILTAYEYISA